MRCKLFKKLRVKSIIIFFRNRKSMNLSKWVRFVVKRPCPSSRWFQTRRTAGRFRRWFSPPSSDMSFLQIRKRLQKMHSDTGVGGYKIKKRQLVAFVAFLSLFLAATKSYREKLNKLQRSDGLSLFFRFFRTSKVIYFSWKSIFGAHLPRFL